MVPSPVGGVAAERRFRNAKIVGLDGFREVGFTPVSLPQIHPISTRLP